MKGTLQKCRVNNEEANVSTIVKLPSAPAYFSKLARKIYKTKGAELMAQKLLSILDIDMFISYCHEYATYLETAEEIAKVPHDSQLGPNSEAVYNRLHQRNKQSWERSKSIAIEFGFTPSSRSRVKKEPEKQQDEFDNFLNSKR